MGEESEKKEETKESETIYNFSTKDDCQLANAVVSLQKTSVTERKVENKMRRGKKLKLLSGSLVASSIENLDSIIGAFSYACGIMAYEFFRRGSWLDAIIFSLGFLISIIAKHRVQGGPITQFLKADSKQIRVKLTDLAKTIYKG